MLRLDKFLSDAGAGTRSEVKKYIRKGLISVNGITVKDEAVKIYEDTDDIRFDGARVLYEKYRYYILNKPGGVVSATKDKLSETVISILGSENTKDLFPVGRLDKDTEGLLLITNDGMLAHRLLSPAGHVPKTYYVESDTALLPEEMEVMEKGVDIGDEKPTLPSIIEKAEGEEKGYRLTIFEGRFHEVKRMFEAFGKKVIYLRRISMGGLTLPDDLPLGEYRKISEDEIRRLFE